VFFRRRSVHSLKPFVWSLLAAGVFIVVRVLYRMIFGGLAFAPSSDTVLFTVPQIALAPPFVGIQLFGVVTLQAVLSAVSAALPFAVVFVAFGAANTLSDPRDLLARAPKLLRSVSASIAIALSVFPAMIRAAQQIRTARALRSDRSVVSRVVPLMEHTIERSESLGLSMAARGFGAPPNPLSASQAAVSVRAVEAQIGPRTLFRDVTLELSPASITVVVGQTGSGKTTLLQVLRGLYEFAVGGCVDGTVLLGRTPVSLADNIGLTSQRPEDSFVAATVQQELMFGPLQRGMDAMAAARHTAHLFEIEHLLHRQVETLSAGEAALVAIAAAASSNPSVLLLDEPVADLDSHATQLIVQVITALNREHGMTVVIAEHHAQPFVDLADRWLLVDDLTVRALDGPPPSQHAADGVLARVHSSKVSEPTERLSLCESLTVTRGRVDVVRDATLWVQPGTLTALVGPNGSGKTSLLEHIALSGGRANPLVAMVSHRVDDMFFRQTVAAEAQANDRNHALEPGTTLQRIQALIPHLDVTRLHPRDCSAGTRVILALALQLVQEKPVLILDEPTRGLDADARASLAALLRQACEDGVAVVCATHDEAFASATADRTVWMRDGAVHAHPKVTS